MYTHLKCIALRTVKYDDRRSIVSVWTAERGRLGLLVPAGASREASRRRALMMPLGLFEGEADIRPGRELFNIHDVKPLAVLPSLSDSPAKAVTALFLAEVLDRILRDTPPDPALSRFIFESVVRLDSMNPRGAANFPLVFLARLTAFLGFEPDLSTWRKGRVFDISGGCYRPSAPISGKWLDAEEAAVAAMVQRLDFDSAQRFPMPRSVRREIISRLLEYYSIHHVPMASIHSLPVLIDLFS